MKTKTKISVRIPSAKSDDQPATRKILKLVRSELKSDIRSLRDDMNSRFVKMELLFEEQNSNNRIVLEGLQTLWQRQDEHSKDRSAHNA